MTETTPADELRAAAELLRTLATAASTATSTSIDKPTTRWHFKEERTTSGFGYLYSENPTGPGTRLTDPGMRTRHGRYAAAVDPTVGLALADWLDGEAARLTVAVYPSWHEACAKHALAVARAINGGGS